MKVFEKTLSELRKDLSAIIADCPNHDGVAITVHGKPVAYLISVKQFEEMRGLLLKKEMASIFCDFDDLFKALSDK